MDEVSPLRLDTSGKFAKLFLYSPRTYSTQVLRPYVYGFSERAAGILLSKGDTMKQAIARDDVRNSEEIASIIKPDGQGTEIEMQGFSALWTFVLILSQPNNHNSGVLAAKGGKLLVFKGHCGDEPIDPSSAWMSTPIINKRCPLFVHTREIVRDNPTAINMFGMHNKIDVCGTTDVIDGSLNQCSKDRELFMLTPSDVLGNFSSSGAECASAPGLCSITNERTPIDTNLKDPGLHLRQILQGIDAVTRDAQTAEFAPGGIDSLGGALSPAADVYQFKEDVVSQLTMMNGNGKIQNGIDITSVVTIEDIERAYPNLVVIPQAIANTAQMEILPQDYATKRTNYSSFAASAISSIAAGVGLSSLSFQFQSYDPAKRDELDKSSFQVVTDNAFLTCPPSDPNMYNLTLKGAVEMFLRKFKNDLVPFIRCVCGEFFIQATYCSNAETTVNLQFLDDSASTNGTGWLETPMRLGSLSTTCVGNKDNFNHNGHSLNAFVMQVQGKTMHGAMGTAAFDRPNVDFGDGSVDDTTVVNPLAGAFGGV